MTDASTAGRASATTACASEPSTGPANAITDVGDVRVGHVTVVRDEAPPARGRGIARTGVTAIVPRAPETLLARPVPAGAAVLNGAGEMTSFLQVSEWGVIETPVYLTATMAVGRVYDGAIAPRRPPTPHVGPNNVVIPAVAECDDSWLCDASRSRSRRRTRAARSPPPRAGRSRRARSGRGRG